jgi:hypothetical protein
MVFETKEQIIKRKKLARYRFRTLIRKAYLNSYWLSELDDVALGENAARNIAIIMKRSNKRRGVLTLNDKTILKKPAEMRTKEENQQLMKLFDALNCFNVVPSVRKNN